MIGKYIVKLVTRFALKRNQIDRISESYEQARRIGLVYTFKDNKQHDQIMALVEKMVGDGKSVETLTFTPKTLKLQDFERPCFTESDFSSKGKWKSDAVIDFKSTSYDYLINVDQKINKYIRNILASSKAKCRVGSYSEESEAYFELMINHSDGNFEAFLQQLYHYITQMKNG